MKRLFTALVLIPLAACAKSPDAIAPVSMPSGMYSHLSCQQARSELDAAHDRLGVLEAAQRSAATGDALGVFLIGVPMSSLGGGDKAGELATEKGRVIALESRLARC